MITLSFPLDTSAGSDFSLFKDMNNGIEPITYKGKEYLVRDLTIDQNAECTVILYPPPNGYVLGNHSRDISDTAWKQDPLPNHILNNLCPYCSQKYREVEYRWRDGTRAGCSCCGAPKG